MTDTKAEAVPSTEPRRVGRRWVLPALTGIAGLLLGVGIGAGVAVSATSGSNVAETATPTKAPESEVFASAVKTCGASRSDAVVNDHGESMTIDTQGEEDYRGISTDELFCIVQALGAPRAVVSHMEQTTSMDGRQEESWDGVTMSFSYHPDRGMDAVLELDD